VKRTLIGVIAAGAVLAAAAPAEAATRYVKVGGLNSGTCTTEATACSYLRVLNGAGSVAGDAVIVAPGTYDVTAFNVEINRKLDIRGADGQPRPVFRDTGADPAAFRVVLAGADTSLRHVEVEATAGSAFVASPKVTLTDVEIRSFGNCAFLMGPGSSLTDSRLVHTAGGSGAACIAIAAAASNTQVRNVEVVEQNSHYSYAVSTNAAGVEVENLRVFGGGAGLYAGGDPLTPGNPARLRRVAVSSGMLGVTLGPHVSFTDSLVRANGSSARALDFYGTPTLRNVTAIATGTGSRGISTQATPAMFALTAHNLLLRGDEADVWVEPDGTHMVFSPGDPICIAFPAMCVPMPVYAPKLTLTHSNFRTVSGPLAPESTANGSGDPRFVDAAAGNFRPGPGSALVDAGVADPANGPTDLDGLPRTNGPAPDVGAYESNETLPPPGGGQNVPPPPNMDSPPPDTAGPALSALGIVNRTFRIGRRPTATAAATRRAPLGTTFRFTSSEPATALLQVARAASGRRRGRACVKPTRSLRRAKKCTRYVRVGVLMRAALSGPNSVPFTGRVGSKALKPGKYMLTVTATDVAGNMTPRGVSGKFKVVKK
jgi:hypothetical protein